MRVLGEIAILPLAIKLFQISVGRAWGSKKVSGMSRDRMLFIANASIRLARLRYVLVFQIFRIDRAYVRISIVFRLRRASVRVPTSA